MGKIIVYIFLLGSFCSYGQQYKGDLKTVSNIMSAQELAWNHADIRGFMDFYWKSDSLQFIGSKGITYGWQKTYDNYVKGYPDKEAMGTLKFTIKDMMQLSKTSIYVIGQWELTKEKPVGGYFTLLWKKINGQWVIVADHTS